MPLRVITRAEIEIAKGKALDELGVLYDLPRHRLQFLESDGYYRTRILAVFDADREREQAQRKAHEAGTGDCCARARARARRTSQAFSACGPNTVCHHDDLCPRPRGHKVAFDAETRPLDPAGATARELAAFERLCSGLPVDSAARKATPVFSGVMKYFPDALCEVAALSMAGNDKHNPGEALHWAKEKSTDEDDCVIRHMLNVAKGEVFDKESYPGKKIRHRAAVAWRALAGLQRELDAEAKARLFKRVEQAMMRPGVAVASITGGHVRMGDILGVDPGSKKPGVVGFTVTGPGAEAAVKQSPGFERGTLIEIEMSNGRPKPAAQPDTWKPVVIIESPYAGHTKRNMIFLKYCERACLRAGEVPIASHRLFTEALDDTKPADRELGMAAGFELHRLADRQVVFAELGITPGMQKGITTWNEIHMHCRPTDFRLLPWDLKLDFERECAEKGARL